MSYVLSDPAGALGGSNFQCDFGDGKLVSTQGNMAWFTGGFTSTGIPEQHITEDGRLFEINNSFLSCLDLKSGNPVWEKCYYNRAHAEVKIHNDLIFTQDDTGSLYVNDLENGDLLWKFNGKKIGLNGGIVSPVIEGTNVIWANNYNAFGIIGSPGKYGAIFTINNEINISNIFNTLLLGKTFTSWDCSSKVTPNIAVRPVTEYHIVNQWSNNFNLYNQNQLTAYHTIGNGQQEVYHFSVHYFNGQTKTFFFKQNTTGPGKVVNYQYMRMYNQNVYEILFNEYFDGEKGPDIFAWLEFKTPI